MAAEQSPNAGASDRPVLRYLLGGLLAFGAINAFAGGIYGIAGAEGVPPEWLEGSPFRDYYIPSLILFVMVGGCLFWAAIAVFARHHTARTGSLLSGMVLLGWIGVQVAIIGYVSWMQPATAFAAIVIVLLALRLGPSRTK
jgi:hypothetical protein